ncbi:beta-1,3-galactosyltransferase 2-like [Pelobates cultripes]|uniref:Hexosyltransferase n=1 Tax=Pelobates cultripes TaxID=61616 RepID=A0AAD1RJK7_PELCU|nr:beta-1,3-galactosyltransferase 2-like [Pelobates cultripes]
MPPYPYPYKFTINQEDKCSSQKPFLVILVISSCHDKATRTAIRETWGNESNYIGFEVVTVFLVGISAFRFKSIQWMLEEESGAFGDIIQQNFLDSYYNLTIKTLMGMQWVATFCPNANFVMKIDSDMFLNVDYLIHQLLLPELPTRTNYFSGDVCTDGEPIRDKKYKWYVPVEVYPNKTYPPYCIGTGYVFSADLAKKIYEVAQVTTVMPMEDVFMGICLQKLNVPLTQPPGHVFNRYNYYDRCIFHKLVAIHIGGKYQLQKVWQDFWSKKSLGCKN